MSNLYDAKLELPAGAYAPDPWDHGDGIALRLDAVISKDENGNPLSCVGDFVWDWTFYTPRKKRSFLSFYFWKGRGRQTVKTEDITAARLELIRELQHLMVLRIYHSERLLGYKSFQVDLLCLWRVARFAEEKGCTLRDVLEKTDQLDAYIADVPLSQCRYIVLWLNFLRSPDPASVLGFEVAKPKRWGELKRRANHYINNQFQTAPLPTRIYVALINALASEIDDIEAHQDGLLGALREALILHGQHKAKKVKEAKGWERSPEFGPDLIAKHSLGDFLTRHGFRANVQGLTGAVTNIFRICKTQIHTFSGMRDEEAEHLPYHCMDTVNAGHGRTHSLIVGVTTKLVGARYKRTRWVTTEAQGFRAIRLAQSFASVIYESLGVTPSTAENRKDDFSLFVSSSYLSWIPGPNLPENSRFAPGSALGINNLPDSLKTALCSIIGAEDIAELEAVDPFRDWAGEPEFAIGQPWPLKVHQLRRSLALYANASGLVKTSSLRRQLQHLTREMAEYYGRGSAFAKNFLVDDPVEYKRHICVDWQDSEQEAQYLAFTRDVLNSEEPLYGASGRFFDLKRQRNEVMSAEEIKEQIRMGRLAYKTHPLGGCTGTGACDKQKGLRLTRGLCVSEHCKCLVGKHSKIIKIVQIQRAFVSRLDPDSIVYAMEKEELDMLEVAELEWQPSNRALTAPQGVTHV